MAQIVTTQHVPEANTRPVADYLAGVIGLRRTLHPFVQFADEPIELEKASKTLTFAKVVLLVELDPDQFALLTHLALDDPDEG